jgi:adenosylmethionine-8-amino-7-oxononanoate aminotransferase
MNGNDLDYLFPYGGWGTVIKGADGVFLESIAGQKLLDLSSSASVANIGYNNPKIKDAIRAQLDKLIFAPPTSPTEGAVKLAAKLIKLFPSPLDTILRSVTGSESVEIALKLARRYTRRTRFLSFTYSYHGHTLGAMAIGMTPESKVDFEPLIQSDTIDHPYIKGGHEKYQENAEIALKQIEERFKTGEYAAFVTEYLMSGPGCFPLDVNFMKKLRALCTKYGVLLIIDEVLTGFGRTGKMFSFEHSGVIPDIVCIAKGLGAGYSPIAATITTKKIADNFDYFATFAWNPLACAASLAVLDVYQEEKIIENSRIVGDYIQNQLKKDLSDNQHVVDIRGLGLKIAIEIDTDENHSRAVNQIKSNGIFLGAADLPRIIPVSPPLIITKDQADKAIVVIIKAIADLDL